MKGMHYLCATLLLFVCLSRVVNAQTYCNPVGNSCTYYHITNVSFGSINNSSTCITGSYANYTSLVTDLTQGTYAAITFKVNTKLASRLAYCFIDFNRNGTFDSKEYTSLASSAGNTYSGYVKVPFNAQLGLTRMRVIYGESGVNSCYPGYSSESEDYGITIKPTTSTAKGHVIYVKSSAPGSDNSGRTWANARTNMRLAAAIATPGDTIKVAAGEYYSGANQTNGIVLSDSVVVLGGYPSSGSPTDAERNPGTRQSKLYGLQSSGSSYFYADYHVFYASRIKDCTVDGFVIENSGHSFGTAGQDMGRGVRIENSSNVIFKNSVFTKNYTTSQGSAISVYSSDAKFINCIITKNEGYYNSILIEKGSKVDFTNFLAAINGGGYLLEADSSQVNFRNSTIANNIFTETIASLRNKTELNVSNSVVYFNAVYNGNWQSYNYDSIEIKSNASAINLRYSLMQTLRDGSNLMTAISPRFRDTSSIAGNDGYYFTPDDGFALTTPCSPALNTGSNTEATGITNDIAGQPRIFGATVDLGAYEIQQVVTAVPKVIYVNPAATGANKGSSWSNAYTDLHKALQACSDTIKLAAGTYEPWKSSFSQSHYWMQNNRVILGGYPSTGNPTNFDRNYELYPTNIDGTTATGEKKLTVMRGIGLDSTAVIDGLVFTNTNATNNNSSEGGALWYTRCINPVISHCRFTKNEVRAFGGKNNQQLMFLSCKIYDNAVNYNAFNGQFFVLNNCGKTTFSKCVFENNNLSSYPGTSQYGTLLVLNSTPAVIDSCIFKINKGTSLSNQWSNAQVSNTVFLNNYGGEAVSNIYNRYANPEFNNCVFRDSATLGTYSHYGGIMNNYISTPVFNNCQFYNGHSNRFGGLAYNDSSSAKFTNCIFSNCNNTFYNINNSNIELTNCINYGSTASSFAAAFMNNRRSNPVITNCVITGSAFSLQPIMTNDGSNPKIRNSVFWKNFGTDLSSAIRTRVEIFSTNASQPDIQNSMFELYNAGGNNKVGEDPRFKNYLNPIGPDSIWFTADDGLQLCDCSGAINGGDNQFNHSPVDITRQPRVFNNSIDRGAYELHGIAGSLTKTAFVNSSATGNNTGASWQNAYTSLQAAIFNACADTIKLAAGIYKPAVKERDSVFILNHSTIILGSYDIASGRRNVDDYPSILSGDIGIPKDTSDNSFGMIRAVYFDSLLLDGVVLQDVNNSSASGYINYSALNAQGLQFLSVKNCRFNKNVNLTYSNSVGGGIYAGYINKLEVDKTAFTGNRSIWGGGLHFGAIGTGRTKIVNCIFTENEASQGGGIYTGQAGSAFINCLFWANRARTGAGLLLNNHPDVNVTNCTFAGNLITEPGQAGAAIRSVGHNWQGGGAGPDITNSIFGDDIYYDEYGRAPSGNFINIRIRYSATTLRSSYYWPVGLISPSLIVYKNISNPIGPDGKWFTDDDGLQLAICSDGIDKGYNGSVTVSKDLLDNARTFNTTVDMGTYEFDGKATWAQLLNVANDSLIANKEVTDSLGWTHYYKGCQYLMSIKKGGQNIGTVGEGGFQLKIVTAPAYNSGTATNLTAASYNTSGMPWYVMNRYWNIKSTRQVQDSMLVRFPYTNGDYNDVKGSNGSISRHEQLEFFKVTGTDYPFDLSVRSSDFYNYKNGVSPTCSQWVYSKQDTVHLAEYYVKSFSGGGGGSRFNPNLADVVISSTLASATSAGSGTNVTLSFTESNVSNNTAAGLHKAQIYLSPDTLLTPGINGDTLLASHDIAPLNALSDIAASKELMIPCNAAAGNYYLLIVADGQNALMELNEYNNVVAVQLSITPGLIPPPTPVITSTVPGAICSASSTILAASASGCTSCDYTWSNGIVGNSITVSTSGNYTITVANACGSASANYTLVVIPTPVVILSSDASNLCAGASVELMASGATNYTWSGNGLSNTSGDKVTATPTGSGIMQYNVTGTTNGCSSNQTISITVSSQVTPSVSINTAGCSGDTITFTANPVNGGNNPQYQWYVNNALQGSAGSHTINGAVTGMQVYVKMTSDAECASTQMVNSSVYTVNCDLTGIPESENIHVYPNPTSGLLVIDSLNLSDRWETLEIINIENGQLITTVNIRNQTRTTLHLEYLAKGIYLIVFKREDGTRVSKKFLKV